MNIEKLKLDIERFGLSNAVYGLGVRAVNRVVELKILKGIWIEDPPAEFLEVEAGYEHGFFDEATLRRFSKVPEYDLPKSFLDEALAKGDRCYGFIQNGELASFGWYSTRPTAVSDEIILHFDPRYAYMYKGFTHPKFRGKRLHAIGMTRALKHLREEGLRGIVSYVESSNFSSLKSCYRMGYKDFGELYMVRAGGRYFLGRDKGCEQFGFRLEAVKSPQRATVAAAKAAA